MMKDVSVSQTPETNCNQMHTEQFQSIIKSIKNPRIPILELLSISVDRFGFHFLITRNTEERHKIEVLFADSTDHKQFRQV